MSRPRRGPRSVLAVPGAALALILGLVLGCAGCGVPDGGVSPSSTGTVSTGTGSTGTGSTGTGSTGTGSTGTGSTGTGSTGTGSTGTGVSPTASPSPLGTWVVGAHPLPLRPDGFGKVRPTPRQLRVRRLPTADLLPPPADGRFHSSIVFVSPAVRRRMGETWSPRCPVPLSALRYLRLTFRGFDGRAHTGELVVNASVARSVVQVFRTLYAASYPVEEMRLPTTRDLEAAPTGDGDNTAAYVCRATRGARTWSAHAYGLAIDVNPFMNPYSRASAYGPLVIPELASSYLDRSWRRPGMVLRGGVVTRAFARVGWTWGGDFRHLSDRMHFSANGR